MVKMALAADVASLYFSDAKDAPPKRKIGTKLKISQNQEMAEFKLSQMSSLGFKQVLDRLEEVIIAEVISAYLDAYKEVGDKEALVYPEEQAIMDINFPADDDMEDDDDVNQ